MPLRRLHKILVTPAKGGLYVLDLAMSLVTVSMKTIELVKSLPAYEEID